MKNPYLHTELKHFMHTFKRQPLLLVKAKGSRVWDEKGREYYDFFSGIAVCGVGHNDPGVVRAIQKQSANLLHSSNYFYTKPQTALAKALTARYKGSRVFFSNSGAEANETAIKLARLWATNRKKKGREIIVFLNAFHGRTLATSAASQGMNRTHNYFAPLPEGFRAVPYNDLAAVKKAVNKNTMAIMLEPVQGEGGIHIASKEFFRGIAALCRKQDLLLIADEIQSGLGRTGTFFAFEQYGVKPDLVTMAKGLAGGLPLGATLAVDRVSKLVAPGMHGSTFGGNPVACAASLEVLKILTPRALSAIGRTGRFLQQRLQSFTRFPSLRTLRCSGLMIGMELNESGDAYVNLARERGLLINCTQGNVLRFLPPYFISRRDLDRCLAILESVFETISQSK
jgi:predicted acetylornithine/succinylornithine family transaminase